MRKTENTAAATRLRLLASIPLLAMILVMAGLYVYGPSTSYESAPLLLLLSFSFVTLTSGFIAILAGKSFLTSGRPALLALCVAMILWGGASLLAVLSSRVGNYNLTIHNLGMATSGFCHLIGAFAAYRYGEHAVRNTGAWLTMGIASGLSVLGLIWLCAVNQWLPPFFIDGVGATRLRTVVLTGAIFLFTVASGLTADRYRRSGWSFLLWYALGLALIGTGALGLILQPTHGSLLGWVARSTQYLGGIYMLTGTILTMRGLGGWRISLEERLIASELAQREQATLIQTINNNTTELIFMKNREGKFTYANAATMRVLGNMDSADGTLDSMTFEVPEEYSTISENDRRVMDEGVVIAAEEIFIGRDGMRRTFASTKSPLRNQAGEIIGVIAVARDVTDSIAAREELRRALNEAQTAGAALRAADQRKDAFLATLAHELRNPLAPVRNMIEILKRGGNEAIVGQAVTMMDRQLEQLVRLVDDLLDVSRINSDKIELRRTQVELTSLIRLCVEDFRPFAESKNHELTAELSSEHLPLNADPVRLAQIFGNLLNNAAKYTDGGGRIEIKAWRENGDAVVSIKDTGMGIPPNQLSSIFELFSQVDGTLERAQGGLGIGLTLVKRLTEMHGGSVTAQSDGMQQGSRFVVRLPLASSPSTQQRESTVCEAASVGRRILVVDDNEDSANSLAMLLTIYGHTVQTAHDGLRAIQLAAESKPDIILLDIGLPGMNGYEVCRRIRQEPLGKHIMIVALTGWGQEEDRRSSQEAGFNYHLVKPVDFAELSSILQKME
ncbi:MAG: ATP-binding protein [Verrucomicrobiota bacterium]